jgi:hypothetical protein
MEWILMRRPCRRPGTVARQVPRLRHRLQGDVRLHQRVVDGFAPGAAVAVARQAQRAVAVRPRLVQRAAPRRRLVLHCTEVRVPAVGSASVGGRSRDWRVPGDVVARAVVLRDRWLLFAATDGLRGTCQQRPHFPPLLFTANRARRSSSPGRPSAPHRRAGLVTSRPHKRRCEAAERFQPSLAGAPQLRRARG